MTNVVVVTAKAYPDPDTLELITDVQSHDPYTSAGLNRKFKGILKPGIYQDFIPSAGDGLNLLISSGEDGGTASIDINNAYQLTIRQQSDVTLPLVAGKAVVVVLEAFYEISKETYQVNSSSTIQAAEIKVLDSGTALASNQLELCKVTIPEGSTQITEKMIDLSGRIIRSIGIELSSAIDSDREDVAASSHAVKKLHDMLGQIDVPDGTLEQKGLVQLSSATDSDDEDKAATPKAVKAAYDLAKGKYTAQDATTEQKGIVQLSSETGSESETQAATLKAVKAANDNANGRVPSGRKVNGRALTDDINVTAQDIFNGQAIGIGDALDLNSYTTPGLYYQPANVQAASGANYPEANAGSLEVYKHAGTTQIYRIYNSSRSYIRSLYGGVWTAWTKQYDAANRPTAIEVAAIPLAGSTAVTGIVRNSGEFQQTSIDGYRMAYGNYGTFWRNDGANLYLMLTNSGNQYGTFNGLRPLTVNIPTGKATIGNGLIVGGGLTVTGQAIPSDYANFDARYVLKSALGANTALKAANGWWQCGSTGLIFQWATGKSLGGTDNQTVTFPKSFPSACLMALVGSINGNNTHIGQNFQIVAGKTSVSKCDVKPNNVYGSSGLIAPVVWAVGY